MHTNTTHTNSTHIQTHTNTIRTLDTCVPNQPGVAWTAPAAAAAARSPRMHTTRPCLSTAAPPWSCSRCSQAACLCPRPARPQGLLAALMGRTHQPHLRMRARCLQIQSPKSQFALRSRAAPATRNWRCCRLPCRARSMCQRRAAGWVQGGPCPPTLAPPQQAVVR